MCPWLTELTFPTCCGLRVASVCLSTYLSVPPVSLRSAGVEQLMYIKEDLIIPHVSPVTLGHPLGTAGIWPWVGAWGAVGDSVWDGC